MDDMIKIPKKLKKDPILEVIFEIRFFSDKEQVAELLPGLLYPKIKDTYPKIEVLAHFKNELFKANPELMYKPTRALVGDSSKIQIGERVISLACRKPYGGWDDFRIKIINLIDALKDCNVVERIERFSMKYLNVLPSIEGTKDLDMLKFNVGLGDFDLKENESGFNLRTEIRRDSYINIIQIIPNANIKSMGENFLGLLLEIDTISDFESNDLINKPDVLLKSCRDTEKMIFFSILTDETIKRLEPVW